MGGVWVFVVAGNYVKVVILIVALTIINIFFFPAIPTQ